MGHSPGSGHGGDHKVLVGHHAALFDRASAWPCAGSTEQLPSRCRPACRQADGSSTSARDRATC